MTCWSSSTLTSSRPARRPPTALLTPLLLDAEVRFVKAAFDRPLTVEGMLHHGSGGRVTEMLARPLLNAWWPRARRLRAAAVG